MISIQEIRENARKYGVMPKKVKKIDLFFKRTGKRVERTGSVKVFDIEVGMKNQK